LGEEGFPLKKRNSPGGNEMESATEKQIMALKKFARNSELSKGILKGIEFKDLDKQQASNLITQCINQNGNTYHGKNRIK